MGKPIWTSGMVNTILDHVEQHKGERGLYMIDRERAWKEAQRKICKDHGGRQVSVNQCRKLLNYIVKKERRPEYLQDEEQKMEVFFREGRRILLPDCDPDELLLREKKGLYGVRSVNRYPASDSPPPTHANPERDPSTSPSPAIESYEFSNGSNKPMAVNPVFTPMDCFEASRDFLAISPDTFLPSRKYLEHLKERTINSIRSAAYEFIDVTGADHEMVPQIFSSLRSPSFVNLCKRVYDANTKEDLLEKFATLQTMSALLLPDFMRALMAAAIFDWIFEGNHTPFATELMEKSQPQAMYENIIAELHPELHEQVLRRRNHAYMKQVDFKLLVPQHVNHFIDDVIPFINSNIEIKTAINFPRWRDGLQHVFMAALEFRAQVMLMGPDFVFRMPRTDDPFDQKSMVTEYVHGQSPKDGRVHVALFPALVHVERQGFNNEVTGERVMYQALVILQSHGFT